MDPAITDEPLASTSMKRFAIGLVRQTVHALVYILVGVFIALITVFTLHLDNRPELKVWHEADLDA